MLTRPFFFNFNGGEVSLALVSRLDLPKYSQSCLRVKDFVPLAQGSITRRPGTYRLGHVGGSDVAPPGNYLIKLIPYALDENNHYILEFGHQYMRVWYNDNLVHTVTGADKVSTWSTSGDVSEAGGVYTMAAGTTPAEIYQTLAAMDITSEGTDAYEVSIDYATDESTLGTALFFDGNYIGYMGNDKHRVKFDGTTYQTYKFYVQCDNTTPALRISDSGFGGCKVKNITCKKASVYSVATSYDGDDVIDIKHAQFDTSLYLAHESYSPLRVVQYGDDDWLLTDLTPTNTTSGLAPPPTFEDETVFADITLSISGNTITADGAVFRKSDEGRMIVYRDQKFLITTRNSGTEVEGVKVVGFTGATIPMNEWGLEGSPQSTLTTTDDGINQTASWTTNLDSFRDGIEGHSDVGRYILANGGIARIVSITSETEVVVAVIRKATAGNASAGSWSLEEPAWSVANGYPSAVCFHEQRLILAGSPRFPQSMWGSKIGSYEDFFLGTTADDAVWFDLTTEFASKIKWLASKKVMIAGTERAEFRVEGASGAAISATSPPIVKQETNYGAYKTQPVLAGQSIIFLDRTGKRVIDYEFTWEQDSFVGTQLNILSDHLFDVDSPSSDENSVRPISCTFQSTGQTNIMWASRLSESRAGTLCGMVYEKTNKIFAWFDTGIQVGSVCVIPGYDGNEVVYFHAPDTDQICKLDNLREVCGDNLIRYIGPANATIGLPTYKDPSYPAIAMRVDADAGDSFSYEDLSYINDFIYAGTFNISSSYDRRNYYIGTRVNSIFTTVPIEIDFKDGNTIDKKKRFAEVTVRASNGSMAPFTINGNTLVETEHGAEGDLDEGGIVKVYQATSYGEGKRLQALQLECNSILPLTIYSISGKMAVGE